MFYWMNYVLVLMNVILSIDIDFMIFNYCFYVLLNCYAMNVQTDTLSWRWLAALTTSGLNWLH